MIDNNYIIDNNYSIDNMTDEEAKEYFEGLETDRWVEEYKNIF